MGERLFYIIELEPHDLPIAPHEITESELKRRLRLIEKADFGPESQIQVLLHGEAQEPEADDPGYDVTGFVGKPPTDREAWIRRFPLVLDQQAVEMIQDWFREEPPR